jgi:Mg2+-importing ATPase
MIAFRRNRRGIVARGDTIAAFWSVPAADLMRALGSGPDGLAQEEADRRLALHGENAVEAHDTLSTWRLFGRQVASPLSWVLIFGALVALTLGEWLNAGIILTIVLGSALLGFSQEYRASAAVAKLRARLARTVSALRDGRATSIDVLRLVPGDVVLLSAGNLVPADGMILEARDFLVSEASLTGESYPTEKSPGSVPSDTPAARRTNSVFLGTSVRSGTAKVLVTETGKRTLLGGIAGRLAGDEPETEFSRGLRQFGYLLTRVMVAVVLAVLIVNLLFERPLVDSLLFAVALAVGLSPELLPAIVSVTLSAGARAMAKDGVIVRRLDAIENLGSINILCTDKTGTLTKGVVALSDVVDADLRSSEAARRLAYLNASLQTGIENPIDIAIVDGGHSRGLVGEGVRKLDEIPYDFLRKRLTVAVSGAEGFPAKLITKGAFDNVLSCCTSIAGVDAVRTLDDAERERVSAFYRDRSQQGFRVLALATKDVPFAGPFDRHAEASMTLAGFLLFFDPLKEHIVDRVDDLQRLGIQIKVITGDNRFVAGHVAGSIGLDPASLLTGEQLDATKDEAFWHLAERTDVFAEVDPQQKERIIHALQRRGDSVGFLGDGINDAPALHTADVGISVDGAVDVARESADIVLLRRDLDVLAKGVLSGRRTFANTLKYISITTSANFGNMISMAIATLFLPFLPLAAKQILLNNFLSDIPSLAISTDNVDPDAIEGAQRWSVHDVRSFMILFGLISTVFDLVTFALLLFVFAADEPLFQTAWFVVSLATELAVLLVLRTHRPIGESAPSPLLLGATIAVGVLAVSLPYLDGLARAFGFIPLSLPLFMALVGVTLAYVVLTEFAKRKYFDLRRP